MKNFKISIYFLFTVNILLFLLLLFIEFKYSETFNKFEMLAGNNSVNLKKIKILDSDQDLYSNNTNSKKHVDKLNVTSNNLPLFILPEQTSFWNRWRYSLLSSMQDPIFYNALTQVRTVGFYNSGYFNDEWASDIYCPFQINTEGLLDLEVLIISWALSDNQYKVTLQYDFYHIKTNKRYYEHVVNIVFAR